MDGRAATITHDDKPHATTRRFVALAVKSSRVIGDCMPHRRARELLKSLRRIDRATQGNPTVHLILNPCAAQKTAEVKASVAEPQTT